MKNLTNLSVLMILISLSFSCEPDNSPEEPENIPEIESIEIQDPNFRHALFNTNCVDTNNDKIGDTNIDSNNDGELQKREAEAVNNLILKLNDYEIQRYVDFSGIEYFINLEYLVITDGGSGYTESEKTDVISYDFTPLNKLEYLQLNFFKSDYIEKIDLSGLDKLVEADLSDNRPSSYTSDYTAPFNFVELKMTGCENLNKLSIVNSFFYLDFCQIPSLEILDMSYLEGGEPDTFDFHCLSKLKWLDISENYFEELILKNNSVLTYFRADDIGSAYYDTNSGANYPFLKYVCIDDIPEEYDQVSTLIDENTVVTTDCTF